MSNVLWDKFYNSHGRFYLLPHPALESFVEKLHEIAALRVLDLGCGSGRHLVALAEKGYDVEGIDFSPAAVRMANEWLERRELPGRAIVGDIYEKLKEYKDNEFDAIIAVNSLNFQSIDDFLKSIKEINRLLKTNGMVFLVLPSKESLILKPEIEQMFVNEDAVRVALKDRLEIVDLHLDEDKCYVVIARETKKA
jgi:SAM-dependent methyltransferase